MCNIIYTICEEEFSKWVKERIDARNSGIILKRKLNVNMDPEVLAAFNKSTAVSSK